jgi:Ca2+-binding EF-hand superfamily protein
VAFQQWTGPSTILKGFTMSTISGVSSANSAWSSMSTSRAQMKDKMFAKVDSDGSGSVDKSELQTMLDDIAKHTGSTSTTSADDVFSGMDSNGDGSLDKSELDKGMKSLMPAPSSTMAFAQSRTGDGGGPEGAGGPPPPPPSDDSSSSSTNYDTLDTNKDGTVSDQERAAGEVKDALKTLLKAADTDGDKKIRSGELDNFKQMLSNAVNDASSSSSSQGGSSSDSSSQSFNLSSLTDMVLKEYAKAASNAASQQSVGSTLSVAA